MITRPSLLNKLDRATDRAASLIIQKGYPIPRNDKGMWVGDAIVEKNSNGFYDILSLDGVILYKDILVFDVATIIAQRYSAGEFSIIKKILVLEEKYSKYRTDMIHYLHCFKGARKRHDHDGMDILEDKFQISESRAKTTRDDISRFKRIK